MSAMTVAELIAELHDMPQDLPVLIEGDWQVLRPTWTDKED